MPRKKRDSDIEMGQRLREAREALNLSQEDFGSPLSYSVQRISNWENGVNGIPQVEMMRIYGVHKISPDWLLLKLLGNLPDHLAAKLRRLRPVEATAPAEKTRRRKAS